MHPADRTCRPRVAAAQQPVVPVALGMLAERRPALPLPQLEEVSRKISVLSSFVGDEEDEDEEEVEGEDWYPDVE